MQDSIPETTSPNRLMVVLVLGVVALTYWAVVDYTGLPGRSRRSAASEAGMLLAVVLFHISVSC